MLDCGFMPPDDYLELQKHESRGCDVATRGKTTMLVTAVARIVYFTQSSFNAVVCCFGLHFGWGSQLNTSAMFWIDISRWMISSRCSWILVYLFWCTAHAFEPLPLCVA